MRTVSLAEVTWPEVPLALARLHAEHPVGSQLRLRLPSLVGQESPGGSRRAGDVINGGGFEADSRLAGSVAARSVEVRRMRTLPDVVGPAMRALICGLNPSLVSADAGFGFAGATNRFWPAALAAGLVSITRQPLEALSRDGVGFTDMVKRATARSHHLDAAEYHDGAQRLERLVAWLEPRVVIFVGLEGWRAARDRRATPGWQDQPMAGVPAYVMPSTSGANARTSLASLVAHFQSVLAGPP